MTLTSSRILKAESAHTNYSLFAISRAVFASGPTARATFAFVEFFAGASDAAGAGFFLFRICLDSRGRGNT